MKKQRRKIGGAVPSHIILWDGEHLVIKPEDLVSRIESAEVGEPMELRRVAPATIDEAVDHIEEAINVLLAMAKQYEGHNRRDILWNCGQMLEQTYQVTLSVKEDRA